MQQPGQQNKPRHDHRADDQRNDRLLIVIRPAEIRTVQGRQIPHQEHPVDIGNHIPYSANQQRQVIQLLVDQPAQAKAHDPQGQENPEQPQQRRQQRPEVKLELGDVGKIQLQRCIQPQEKAQRQGQNQTGHQPILGEFPLAGLLCFDIFFVHMSHHVSQKYGGIISQFCPDW